MKDVEDEETPEVEQTPPEQVESSLEELLAKKSTEGDAQPEEEAEEDAVIPLGREERVETLAVKVVPQQPTEFVCKNCFLVKHRSQLADKKRMLCRDCV